MSDSLKRPCITIKDASRGCEGNSQPIQGFLLGYRMGFFLLHWHFSGDCPQLGVQGNTGAVEGSDPLLRVSSWSGHGPSLASHEPTGHQLLGSRITAERTGKCATTSLTGVNRTVTQPADFAATMSLTEILIKWDEVKASIRCDASHTKSPVKAKRPAAKAKPKAKDAPIRDRTRK